MSYKVFVRLVWGLGICSVLVIGMCAKGAFSGGSSPSQASQRSLERSSEAVYVSPPAVEQPSVARTVRASTGFTTSELRNKVESWLNAHGNRRGRTQWKDIMPDESFRAIAVRFQEADASKWSNDPDQWSQIRLDLDRDGVDDEKWLLKNGHTYKREVLDRSGCTTKTEYFK